MLKEILLMLGPCGFLLLLSLSLGALLANLGLLGASAWLISSAALLPPLYALTLGITAVRALGIGRAVLRYGERYFTHAKAFALLEKLRLRLYDMASTYAHRPLNRKKQGTMLNALLDKAATVQDFLLRGLLPPVTLLCALLLATLMLYPFLKASVLLLPLLYLIHLVPLWLSPEGSSRHSSAYRSRLLDYTQGRTELLLAGTMDTPLTRLGQSARNWQKRLQQSARRQEQLDLVLGVMRITVFVLLFTLLIDAMRQDRLTGITMSLWLLILLALLQEFALLPAALRHFREARLAARALQNSPVQITRQPETSSNLLTVENLGFHYPQGPAIFQQLSFSLQPGCHTAIIGDSGCGKTTLAYLLTGLWAPAQGSIHYSTAAPVCAIPQGSFLFSQSIRENFLRLHPDITEEQMLNALQAAQMLPVIQKLPRGLDTPLGENACFLSGGERNRLSSALILASSAPLLLFDEPTAGLDLSTARKVLDNIIDRSNLTGQTVIVITHDLPQVHRFSQVMKLQTGLSPCPIISASKQPTVPSQSKHKS